MYLTLFTIRAKQEEEEEEEALFFIYLRVDRNDLVRDKDK